MKKIYLQEIEEHQLLENIRKIVIEELCNQQQRNQEEKLLSPAEVCKLFNPNISKVTIYNWTKQGKLKKHAIGRKVFYKYSELIVALKTLKRFSADCLLP
jgi:excisionase family DNA binding protein